VSGDPRRRNQGNLSVSEILAFGDRLLYPVPLPSCLPLARHRHRHRHRASGSGIGVGIGNRDRESGSISSLADSDTDTDTDSRPRCRYRCRRGPKWRLTSSGSEGRVIPFPRLLWTCPSCGPHKLETEGSPTKQCDPFRVGSRLRRGPVGASSRSHAAATRPRKGSHFERSPRGPFPSGTLWLASRMPKGSGFTADMSRTKA
jgi:hypothetical protein